MYPLFLKLKDRACLVIGGGVIATRKTESLLEAGAVITLISPDVTDELRDLIDNNSISYRQKFFQEGDTSGFFLIIAATNSREANEVVYREAEENQSLINCVDDPDYCNFYVPAQVKRGSLKIAISTEGKLPLLARRIRLFLESCFSEDLGLRIDELGMLRRQIIADSGNDVYKKEKMFSQKLTPSIDKIMENLKV
jgi:precorrin-2 dehydrogenase/sirohydrochlorin ferrochelatase